MKSTPERYRFVGLTVGLAVLGLLSSGASGTPARAEAVAKERPPEETKAGRARPDRQPVGVHSLGQNGGELGTGTVQYDPPGPADILLAANLNWFVGNRFDTRNGNPLSSGVVTQIAAYWGPAPTATYPVWGIKNVANTQILHLTYVPGQVPLQFNTLNVSWAVPSVFLGGLRIGNGGFPSSAYSVGVRYSSYNSQGFHGLVFAQSTSATSQIASGNAMFRVSGDLVIPVELVEFELER